MMSGDDFEAICASEFIPWEKLSGKRIMITGATGLIGYSLVTALLYVNKKMGLKLEILALVRDEQQARRRFEAQLQLHPHLDFLVGDIKYLPAVCGEVDYILHGASQTASKSFVEQPVETIQTSVLGTLQMLELARQKHCSGFVYMSSMEVYGHPPKGHKVKETDGCILQAEEVRNSYPVSKLLCENMCCAYAAEYGIRAIIARLGQTFGPDVHPDDKRIFAELGRCIRDKRNIVLRTRGETQRCYLYVADAITALLTIMCKGQAGVAYNVADEDTYCSIAELVQRVATESGIGIDYELNDGDKYGNPIYMDMDTSRLRSLGWFPGIGRISGMNLSQLITGQHKT